MRRVAPSFFRTASLLCLLSGLVLAGCSNERHPPAAADIVAALQRLYTEAREDAKAARSTGSGLTVDLAAEAKGWLTVTEAREVNCTASETRLSFDCTMIVRVVTPLTTVERPMRSRFILDRQGWKAVDPRPVGYATVVGR